MAPEPLPREQWNVLLEDVDMPRFLRNFAGNEGPMNRKGARNFCIILDEADLQKVDPSYWNVKALKPREEGDTPRPYLQVTIRWPQPTDKKQGKPPTVVMITDKLVTLPNGTQEVRKARTSLDEDMVALLDWAAVSHVDLKIRPYEWDYLGKTGIKAMVVALYVTIESDELELKYSDIPEASNSAGSTMQYEYDEVEEA